MLMVERLLTPPHVNLSRIGRFKQEEGEQKHFLPVAMVTGSGLILIKWSKRLLDEKRVAGLTTGFVFLSPGGNVAKASDFE
jgi:hypothetical protein